jgi:iron complex outermembrane receptor protein
MNRYFLYIIIASALCISWSSTALAANTLKGSVKDSKGQTLPGAVIAVPDLKIGTVADSNGNYLLTGVPKGKFVVVASLLSYATTTITLNINGPAVQNFVLSESAIESKEVVITGQSKATEIERSPIPVLAISKDYLQNNISSNIIDAIAKVPGVTAVTTGPNISKPFIRGLGYNRVLTLYDGMRQEGQQWGDEHGIEVDEYSIDRIEVVKGPASLIYGSDALAGVVNLIPTPPPPDGHIAGNFSQEYQSNNNLIGTTAMLSGNQGGFYWLGRVSHKQAMDYQDPIDGRVYATNFNETDANASFGWNKKWGYSHVTVSMFNDLQAIPDGSRDSATRQFTRQVTELDSPMSARPVVTNQELNTYQLPVLHQHVQLYRVMWDNNINLANGLLAVDFGFERSIRQEFSHPQYGDIPGLDLQLNTYTYDLKYFFHSIAGWDFTAGVNGMYQTNNVTQGTEFVIPSYNQFDVGPFAVFKKNFGKFDFAGGVRYDSRTFHNDALYQKTNPSTLINESVTGNNAIGADTVFNNYSNNFSGFTYSLGGTYIFSKKFAIKANIARGFRAPNIAEISSNGVHPGTGIYQIGNPDFKPEFSLQEDIGMEYTSRHISINVSVFNNSISNYIFNQKVLNSKGQDSVIVTGNETFKFAQSNARLFGGEASLDIHPHPLDWLHFENSISIVYGVNEGGNGVKINDSDKYLPQIPAVHGLSELRGNFKHPARGLVNSYAKVQLAMYAAQNRVYLADNTETPTPGYVLLNAGLGSDFTNRAGKAIFNIGIFGNNLANVAYQDNLSRLKYFEEYPTDPRGHLGIYNMGRNIGIKLSIPINVK